MYLPSFSGEFDMLESESDTLRFVSSWHSDAESECNADPDCVAIVKERLLLIIYKLASWPGRDQPDCLPAFHNA